MKKFRPEICKKLGYYVYRLVDPSNGETFYVGRGSNSRCFDHANEVDKILKSNKSENAESLKVQRIKKIKKLGLDVIILIHRHNLELNMAKEIEAALIDAFPGLSNVQNGYKNSDYGCANVSCIEKRYRLPIAELDDKKYVIIKVRESSIEQNNGSIYETVRKYWKIDINRAKGRNVLACEFGIIIAEFTDIEWKKGDGDFSNRSLFIGREVEDSPLLQKRLPKKFVRKGQANPILYA